MNTRGLPSRECSNRALGANTQAFRSRESFKHAFVVSTKASRLESVPNMRLCEISKSMFPFEECFSLALVANAQAKPQIRGVKSRSKFGRQLELDSTCRRPVGVRSEVGGARKSRNKFGRQSPKRGRGTNPRLLCTGCTALPPDLGGVRSFSKNCERQARRPKNVVRSFSKGCERPHSRYTREVLHSWRSRQVRRM